MMKDALDEKVIIVFLIVMMISFFEQDILI
jgi:hypothetical protein